MRGMQLRHLAFSGPEKELASIEFGEGLNIIYGASNTGKSSVFDAIDFILGRDSTKKPLKEIPQHEGYDILSLGVKFPDGQEATLSRSLQGGSLLFYDGLHLDPRNQDEPRVMRAGKPTKKEQSLNDFIMEKLDLSNKRLKRNAKNETNSLTLRSLLPLYLINETQIQTEESPYIGSQYIQKTVDKSRLKFLLTGVDDSALIAEERESVRLSRAARLSIMDDLIYEAERRASDQLGDRDEDEIHEQIEVLTERLEQLALELRSTESEFERALELRNTNRREVVANETRLGEAQEMLKRFALLKIQYDADINRLQASVEAGSLFARLDQKTCPMCGAAPDDQKAHDDCMSDVSEVVSAAEEEIRKIVALDRELDDVVSSLKNECATIERLLPGLRSELEGQTRAINAISPNVTKKRATFTEVSSKKQEIQQVLVGFSELQRLQVKRDAIANEKPAKTETADEPFGLPTHALSQLSMDFERFLKDWGMDASPRAYFDKETHDFVISGKHRASNGKGHRAITHAAATLALLRYASTKGMPTLGFAIIDTPLLAFEEPEGDDKLLIEGQVNNRFFDDLSGADLGQVIVIENRKSIPISFFEGDQIVNFTKNFSQGRFGLFPVDENTV